MRRALRRGAELDRMEAWIDEAEGYGDPWTRLHSRVIDSARYVREAASRQDPKTTPEAFYVEDPTACLLASAEAIAARDAGTPSAEAAALAEDNCGSLAFDKHADRWQFLRLSLEARRIKQEAGE